MAGKKMTQIRTNIKKRDKCPVINGTFAPPSAGHLPIDSFIQNHYNLYKRTTRTSRSSGMTGMKMTQIRSNSKNGTFAPPPTGQMHLMNGTIVPPLSISLSLKSLYKNRTTS